ncbi:type VI secretion system tip protein VgrG [Moritella sp. 36]|uniref:type VI secretion system Vgr family protein n=1 Tax=Moritella sp. 36 TaxID=2746233 RepID=UPI001BA89582|nr:type VI secretion system tip protein TssI/VgrG [Moritella sp. 36]QUM89435.1 type VI secretion system tip protein VgrG [Moritella sp. 36]
MAAATQQHSMMKITTPLGGDALHITAVSMQESISALYEINASVYTTNSELDYQALLGQSVTIELAVKDSSGNYTRNFNGIVTSISSQGQSYEALNNTSKYYRYTLIISPQLWLATMRSNCRIFQDLSVIDIASLIFPEHNIQFVNNAGTTFKPYEYCVQYHETDYQLLTRLFAQEGIYFYFKQSSGSNSVILANSTTSHVNCAESPLLQSDEIISHAYVSTWSSLAAVKPGKVSLRAINFEQPLMNIDGSSVNAEFTGQDNLEHFEYVSGHKNLAASNSFSATQLEQLQSNKAIFKANSNYVTIESGKVIAFSKHATQSLVGPEFLITRNHFMASQGSQLDVNSKNGMEINSNFCCVENTPSYQPIINIHKPIIRGVQTAIVTGAASDEIYVDSYGRIKVKFYWDRLGTSDENSSCWIRVSQNWAGKNWGAFFYPRVGQEVLVSFLDGDASQPIVIGAIYNGDQMPANPLPANKTQSGIRTHSTTTNGNANCNELIFEDKIGSELLGFRAEKDHQLVVVNNQTDTVGNDRTTTVTNNDTLTVTNDQTQTVNNDRNSKIANNDTLDVGNILKLKAATEIKLEVGSASLLMKSDGTIKLSGVNIEISGTNVKVKGSATNIEGSMVVVKGSVVKIN